VPEVLRLHQNREAAFHAQQNGLAITKIQWEDTGRWQDQWGKNVSAFGSNISDFTLRMSALNSVDNLCPVVRFPNFRDRGAFIPLEKFQVSVGGDTHSGGVVDQPGEPTRIPLKQYLQEHVKDSSKRAVDLTAPIDTEKGVLTVAQQCVLPLRDGKCAFNPHVFSYQTRDPANPALLMVVTQ
jgi:hypothetical protein